MVTVAQLRQVLQAIDDDKAEVVVELPGTYRPVEGISAALLVGGACLDLDGQLLALAYNTFDARDQHGDIAEWVLVATGTYDLPRLQELATRSAELLGFEPEGEDPLLEIANRADAEAEAMMNRDRGWIPRRLLGSAEPPPPRTHRYTR